MKLLAAQGWLSGVTAAVQSHAGGVLQAVVGKRTRAATPPEPPPGAPPAEGATAEGPAPAAVRGG